MGFFCKKSEKWGGVFFVKSGPFLNAGFIMYSISIFLFYILLIWGLRMHPTHPPPAYGPAILVTHGPVRELQFSSVQFSSSAANTVLCSVPVP